MTRYILLLAVVCASASFISCEPSCVSEVEEGTSSSYDYILPSPWSFYWTVTVSGKSQTVARCQRRQNCTNYFPSEFNASLIEGSDIGAESSVTYLTIKSLNRSMTKVECKNIFLENGECDLVVFTRPRSLSCYSPEVKDTFIKVHCISPNEVFPNPVCRFHHTLHDPQFKYSITYDKSYRTCTLLGRPTSLNNRTELRFYAEMYPNVTEGINYKVGLDDWMPPITVETVKFTANNKRTFVEVKSGSDVDLACSFNSAYPYYTLNLFQGHILIASGGEGENSVRTVIQADSRVSGTEYFCRAWNFYPDILVLSDSFKLYVKGPLQLSSGQLNNTVVHIRDGEDISLGFSVWGYPDPQSFVVRYRLHGSFEWNRDYKFHKSYDGYRNEIPPRYNISLKRQDPYIYLDADYSLEISNGEGPEPLRIHFTFSHDEHETSTTPSYRSRSRSSRRDESWIWGVILGSVGLCLTVAAVICFKCRRQRRQQRRTGQVISVAGSRMNNSGQTGSNAGPLAPTMSSSTTVYYTDTSGGHVRFDPPAYDELSTGPDQGHVSSTESTRDTQQVDAPPSYDTVSKPEELPPPYPGL